MNVSDGKLQDILGKLLPRCQVERMLDLLSRMDATTVQWRNIIPIPEDKMLLFNPTKIPICTNLSETLKHVAIVCTIYLYLIHPILCLPPVTPPIIGQVKWRVGY